MNASARPRTLIIGIGNPLRSDDGLGWAVAEQLLQECSETCDIHMVHQLTPDLAQWIADASQVILIDASREGEPGALCVRWLSFSAQPGAIGTHHATPEELAALTTVIYGHCPPIALVSMTGANFEMGECFSPVVARNVALACEVVRRI
jgi:hydrogenase maturation protease